MQQLTFIDERARVVGCTVGYVRFDLKLFVHIKSYYILLQVENKYSTFFTIYTMVSSTSTISSAWRFLNERRIGSSLFTGLKTASVEEGWISGR